jgi:hypothetical protein
VLWEGTLCQMTIYRQPTRCHITGNGNIRQNYCKNFVSYTPCKFEDNIWEYIATTARKYYYHHHRHHHHHHLVQQGQ